MAVAVAGAGDTPEVGRDVLDPPRQPSVWARLFPARGVALGLGASPAPSLTFILTGMLLGPQVLAVVTTDVIVRMDPVVSIALAALGVFVGLGLAGGSSRGEGRLLAAALLEVALSVAVVAGLLYVLLVRWAIPLPASPWLFALAAGTCAGASAAVRARGSGDAAPVARLVDLDDAPLVVLAAMAVAIAGARPVGHALVLTAGAALCAGVAGWLLFERARSEAERGVFVAGIIALLGGVGAHAGTSPLLSGTLAALLWAWSPGRADPIIAADLRKLQHPLVALLLIVAGASVQWHAAVLWIAAPLVMLRLIGKLLASVVAARVAVVPTGLLATVLLPPGVLGVAIALNVQQALGTRDMLLLSGVTVAAVASELLTVFLRTEEIEETS